MVRQDKDIAKLAEQFVCVRIQSMNNVNLTLFQFERDLTWMAFFMDAHDRFYARYGGREDSEAESHLTKDSLLRTMREVLTLHRSGQVQHSRYEPGREPVLRPEEIPTMKPMMAKRKDSQCIHCHDVKVAELKHLQNQGRFTRDLVFTYPAPSAVGILLDSNVQNKVRAVSPRSPAALAGIRDGDIVLSVDGERVLTFADFTRVLEMTPPESTLPLQIQRGSETLGTTLKLSGPWRRTRDPSWRESLHVAGPNGGFWGHKLAEADRKKSGLPADRMAVKVTFIWGDYTRKAGIQVDDIVVQFDGLDQDLTLPQLHAHLNLNRNFGDVIPLTVRRGAQDHSLSLALPKERPQED